MTSVVSVICEMSVVAIVYKPLLPIKRKVNMTLTPAKAKATSTPRNTRRIIVKNKIGVKNSALIIGHP